MSTNSIKIGWGMSISGKMLHIFDVRSGLKCNCICPDCGTKLVAKKGQKNRNHFAHSHKTDCNGMSALHKAAQQILEKSAKNKMTISVPLESGAIEKKDNSEQTHYSEWKTHSFFTMESAKQEVHLDKGKIISDVIIQDKQGNNIAIEIYVTNKKEDHHKKIYSYLNTNSLEIDLSNLPWDSNEETIKNSVLNLAPRIWLYSNRSALEIEKSKNYLEAEVNTINLKNQNLLDLKIQEFRSQETKNLEKLQWPSISKSENKETSYGKKIIETENTQPKITRLTGKWTRGKTGWKTEGLVNNITNAKIYFLLSTNTKLKSPSQPPTVIIIFNPSKPHPHFENPKWINITKWYEKLSKTALTRLELKVKKYDVFTNNLSKLSDKEKLAHVSKKMNLEPPNWSGKVAPGWNTSWSVWKSIVWHYFIQKNKTKELHIDSISHDLWLAKIFNWNNDKQLQNIRSKHLWYWFSDLTAIEILTHEGRQIFTVKKIPPKPFYPWKKLTPTFSPHETLTANLKHNLIN